MRIWWRNYKGWVQKFVRLVSSRLIPTRRKSSTWSVRPDAFFRWFSDIADTSVSDLGSQFKRLAEATLVGFYCEESGAVVKP